MVIGGRAQHLESQVAQSYGVASMHFSVFGFCSRDGVNEILIHLCSIRVAVGDHLVHGYSVKNVDQAAYVVGVRMSGYHDVDALDTMGLQVLKRTHTSIAAIDEGDKSSGR